MDKGYLLKKIVHLILEERESGVFFVVYRRDTKPTLIKQALEMISRD